MVGPSLQRVYGLLVRPTGSDSSRSGVGLGGHPAPGAVPIQRPDFLQSAMKPSMPLSVRGCWIIWSKTLVGMVAT